MCTDELFKTHEKTRYSFLCGFFFDIWGSETGILKINRLKDDVADDEPQKQKDSDKPNFLS